MKLFVFIFKYGIYLKLRKLVPQVRFMSTSNHSQLSNWEHSQYTFWYVTRTILRSISIRLHHELNIFPKPAPWYGGRNKYLSWTHVNQFSRQTPVPRLSVDHHHITSSWNGPSFTTEYTINHNPHFRIFFLFVRLWIIRFSIFIISNSLTHLKYLL